MMTEQNVRINLLNVPNEDFPKPIKEECNLIKLDRELAIYSQVSVDEKEIDKFEIVPEV